MRESIRAVRCDFLSLQVHRASGSGRGKSSAIMHIAANAVVSGKSPRVALKPPVSRLGARIRADTQMDRQTAETETNEKCGEQHMHGTAN